MPGRPPPGQGRDPRAGPVRLGAAALQPALPADRARAAAALPGRGPRRDPLQSAGRRLSLRQASPRDGPPRGPGPLATRPPAADRAIGADLKARRDELTREYRWGDDPR